MAAYDNTGKSGGTVFSKLKQSRSALAGTIRQHWTGLSERERMLVGAGIIFILLLLCYFFVIEPLKQSLDRKVSSVEQLQNDVLWMEQQLPGVEQLKTRNPSLFQEDPRPFPALVEQTLADYGLRDATDRIVPENDRVQVWMEKAALEKVLRWLDYLGSYRVSVSRIDISPHEDGLGNVDLVLELEK